MKATRRVLRNGDVIEDGVRYFARPRRRKDGMFELARTEESLLPGPFDGKGHWVGGGLWDVLEAEERAMERALARALARAAKRDAMERARKKRGQRG